MCLCFRQSFANDGSDVTAEELGCADEFVVCESCDAHLEAEARDAAEIFVDAQNFFSDSLRIADDQCAAGPAQSVELIARYWRPSAFLADLGEGLRVAGEEVFCGLIVGVGDVAQRVNADFERFGRVACACSGFAIEIDEGTKTMGLASDDCDHQREAEDSGSNEGLRRAANA